MEYKYPIETHNSVGFKNTSDFNNEAFNDYLHQDRQNNRSGYLTCSYDELKNLLGNPIKLSANFMYPETVKKKCKNYFGKILITFTINREVKIIFYLM